MSLAVYTNRNIVGYLALSIPALALQLFFILALLKIPAISFPGIFHYADLVIRVAPLIVLAVSFFAVARFRISLLLTLLVVSYFISAVTSGSASLNAAGYLLTPGEIAALVVAASFCSLISFGFLRAAKIEKRRAVVTSKGPLPYQAFSMFLELFLPALVAVGLILATIRIVDALEAETMLFPQPLASIFSSFLLSPIITIVTAALALVLVRDLVEPWILYYTLTSDDAVTIMKKEATEMETTKGISTRMASGGVMFSAIVIVILLVVVVLLFGTQALTSNLLAIFGMGKPTSQPDFLVRIGNAFVQFENLLNTAIHLLWG